MRIDNVLNQIVLVLRVLGVSMIPNPRWSRGFISMFNSMTFPLTSRVGGLQFTSLFSVIKSFLLSRGTACLLGGLHCCPCTPAT